MHFVFITGGVASSLGKGIASASLATLLKSRKFKVRIRKLDPYLNVDPGTMSPYQHGEVYVTDDGAETDLDLGHYERFTNQSAKQSDSVSSGKIYSNVLLKERKGDYLGSTIQVIPHVTNEIKSFINSDLKNEDIAIYEIGGTVGDIESLPFLEAIREFKNDVNRNDVAYIHVTLLPFIKTSGEIKTKPTQHSVKELRSIGIQPDLLVCRSDKSINEGLKKKLSGFCGVNINSVIEALDADSIYSVPLSLKKEGLCKETLKYLELENKKCDLKNWEQLIHNLRNPGAPIKVALVGKYIELEDAYLSVVEALKHAPRFRIHTFISTSPLHMKHKLNMSPEDVYESIGKHVAYARKFTDDVEWSCEDGTRTDMDYMCKTVELAIQCGAKTINIPDTVGYTIPSEFTTIIQTLLNKVPNIDKAILSTHCHNDLGLAVANSLAGVQAGARQIECTINGLGERAGNAALEEVVMAIKTRPDLMPYDTGINTTLLSKASKIVSNATGFPVQYNKAIVGKNAFAHEAGIHQDGMLKNRQTYEIMTPESVGVKQTSLVMGKHSGRHAFKDKLNSLGYPDLTDDVVGNAFAKFKVLADKKKHVYDEDIIALVDDSLIVDNKVNAITLKSLKVFAGTGEPQKAEMTLDVYGDVKNATETGDGPVDAIFKCIKTLYPHDVNLQLYQVHAVTEGTDAQATVSVKIEEKGKTTVGQAADTDTLVASANAYINALNKMIIKRDKTAPMEQESQKVRGI